MPVSGATTAKTARSRSGTRFAIVIDSVSDTAAKTMQNGKTTKISASSMTEVPRGDTDRPIIGARALTAGERSAVDFP